MHSNWHPYWRSMIPRQKNPFYCRREFLEQFLWKDNTMHPDRTVFIGQGKANSFFIEEMITNW